MSTYLDLARNGAYEYRDEALYTFLLDGESQEIQLTWAQLDNRARAIAAQLQEQGLAGQRVLLVYPAGLDYIVAFFACLYSGAIAVPAYPPMLNRSVSQLRNVIADASIAVALTNGEVFAVLDTLAGIEPALAPLSWIVSDKVPDERADDWRPPLITTDSIAFLQYTSGSTSAPKGAMVTHGNLMHCGAVVADILEPNARLLSWLPQYHDLGLLFGVLQPVYARNPVILMSPIDFLRRPARWIQAISRYRVAVTAAPNFAYDLCVRKTTTREAAELDLSCWQVAVNAAEPVQAATLDRFDAAFAGAGFRKSTPVNVYGLAEGLMLSTGPKDEPPQVTTFDATSLAEGVACPANGQGGVPVVSAGRAIDGQRVLIVDATSKTECDPGRVGEIWAAGRSVARGYWGRPGETRETFGALLADGTGPFLRTGDVGFIHDEELYVTGRSKDIIIVRGQNIYPQDLERTAEGSHPALRPGCVAAVGLRTGAPGEGDQIGVVQEVRSDCHGVLAESAAAVRQAIASAHGLTLDAVVLIAAGGIPKTSSGKIRRHETRRMLLANEFHVLHEWRAAISDGVPEGRVCDDIQPSGVARSESEIEAWLIVLLSERLGTPAADIDTRAPFVKLGLNSVQAVEVAADLTNWLGFTVPSLITWEHPTIEQVARHLATEAARRTRVPVEFHQADVATSRIGASATSARHVSTCAVSHRRTPASSGTPPA